MVGQLLEHLGARFGLALGDLGGQLDPLRRVARSILERPLQREIDEAGDLLAVSDRDLPRDQRRHAHRLQRRQQVADPPARLVDAIDEDHVRDAQLVEHPQARRGQRGARGVGIDHHDRHIGDRHRIRPVGGEPDRSGRVDDREAVAQIIEMHQIEFGRSAARPRFRAAVADGGSVGGRSLPRDRPAGEQQRLGQAGLARAGRSDQRDGSCAVGR